MSWESHALQDNYFHCFENVCLKQKVGEFEVGTKFHLAIFDNRTFVLSLYETDKPEKATTHDFPLAGFVFGDERKT